MAEVMLNLAAAPAISSIRCLKCGAESNVAYVIIGAERGLAGSFNSNVMNKAMAEISEHNPEQVKLVLVGKKAVAFFRKRPYEISADIEARLGSQFRGHHAESPGRSEAMFESNEVDAVYLVYAKFITAMRQEPVASKLLPMAKPEVGEFEHAEFVFEPDRRAALGSADPEVCGHTGLPGAGRIAGQRAGRPHDRDVRRHQERR